MRRALAAVVLALAFLPAAAVADTENCTSAGEYNALQPFMSVAEVRALFDLPGRDEGDTLDGDYFRMSWRGCAWTDGGRVWTWHSYNGLGLQRWEVR